ncbi:MAG: type VI secretion system-associated protein TagF [Desulfomonilia bacterium]
MLGPVRSRSGWVWGAGGKLPVARDYIRFGVQTPLLKAFSDWVESGWSTIGQKPVQSCSWRFWARGIKREELACGLLRDSSDSLGRPYPFIVLGTGTLKGWEEKWDFLPLVFHDHWNRMEYLSTRRVYDFHDLEGDLNMMYMPVLPERAVDTQGSLPDRFSEYHTGSLKEDKELFIPMESSDTEDPDETLVLWHTFLKEKVGHPPTTVFIGGTVDSPFLVLFQRSLMAQDFNRLWNAGH